MNAFRKGCVGLLRHRSVLGGVIIIIALIGLSVFAVIAIPYSDAIREWSGSQGIWDDSPKDALPSWVNLFSTKKLPETIILDTQKGVY